MSSSVTLNESVVCSFLRAFEYAIHLQCAVDTLLTSRTVVTVTSTTLPLASRTGVWKKRPSCWSPRADCSEWTALSNLLRNWNAFELGSLSMSCRSDLTSSHVHATFIAQ